MKDAWLDLFLGTRCTVCGAPGRLLCGLCRRELPRGGYAAWPTPCPEGLVLPMAAGEYDGALKAMINAHKERAMFALASPLGEVLAGVVQRLVADVDGPWLLVPVPSRAGVVRNRGHDPMLRVARSAAAVLRRRGVRTVVAGLLRAGGDVRDQAGLDASERAANLVGSMRGRDRLARRVQAAGPVSIVLVDDVITTGATAREAQRALEAAGLRAHAVAAIAATRKRLPTGERPGVSRSLPISGAAH